MTTVRVQITGGSLRVDAADAPLVEAHRWYVNSHGYAVRRVRLPGGRREQIAVHRLLMGLAAGDPREVDHRNRDTLDCRRSNMRLATRAQNRQNTPSCAGSTSPFRGVYYDRSRGAWRALAEIAGRKHYFGPFTTELAAAEAVDAFRMEHMPFAEPDAALAEAGAAA
jgi:hypothetical protein